MSKTRVRRIFFWAQLAAILLTLLFIFTNSLRAPGESMEQSNAARGFLEVLFSYDKPLGKFVLENVRKIAHFAEYAFLGAEIAAFVMFHLQKPYVKAALLFPLAMCVAVIDETLQYFSGRGPAIADVWIDLGGFAAGLLVCYGIIMLVLGLRVRISKRNEAEALNG